MHAHIQEGSNEVIRTEIQSLLSSWVPVYRAIKEGITKSAELEDIEVLALSLSDLAKIALHVIESGTLTEEEAVYYKNLSANAKREINGMRLGPAKCLVQLINSYRDGL